MNRVNNNFTLTKASLLKVLQAIILLEAYPYIYMVLIILLYIKQSSLNHEVKDIFSQYALVQTVDGDVGSIAWGLLQYRVVCKIVYEAFPRRYNHLYQSYGNLDQAMYQCHITRPQPNPPVGSMTTSHPSIFAPLGRCHSQEAKVWQVRLT